MRNNLPIGAEKYTTKNRLRRIWQKLVQVMACIVVFCTTYALILPAITQEKAPKCGLAEHSHTEACYQISSHALICTLPEQAPHVHTEACYQAAHVHTDECFRMERGALVCTLAEAPAHTHTAECRIPQLTCELPENHVHGDGCWQESPACTKQLDEGHIHGPGCMGTVRTLICTVPERHVHGDGCYTLQLVCAAEETAGHTHGDSCYAWEQVSVCSSPTEQVLICALPETPGHTHTDSCFSTGETAVLSCGLEAHSHSLACASDPKADLESAVIWEKSIASAKLTGNWSQDVVAIARTQLGYVESTDNFRVLNDGISIRGYSRYGAWYGDPYGDWCAMFVSFCLRYAGVDMPLESNVDRWIEKLSAADTALYHRQGSYIPEPGQLIFFDWDGDGSCNHVGIVTDVSSAGNGSAPRISTIEGNSANQVRTKTYAMDDATILGYGALPVQLSSAEQTGVNRVTALIDALPGEGGEAYRQQVAEAYYYYARLSADQKRAVPNAAQLLALEPIWSVTAYSGAIDFTAPTEADWVSTADFVELNLYDYNQNINKWWQENKNYPGFQWNGGAYSAYSTYNEDADEGIPDYSTDRNRIDSIDFGNSLITDFDYGNFSNYGKAPGSTRVGNQGGQINALDYFDGEYTNRPIGYSTDKDALSRTLLNGYPALLDGSTSLSYLFGDETADVYDAVTKMNTHNIDGLFMQNSVSGAYSFNSRENHAQFRAEDDHFVLYDQIITPNFITYPFGNFLPMNSITDQSQATQVGKFNYDGGMAAYFKAMIGELEAAPNDGQANSRNQLSTMLREYQENWKLYPYMSDGAGGTTSVSWDTLSAANAIRDYFLGDTSGNGDKPSSNTAFITQEHLDRLYNIDYDVPTNFFFGMEMKMELMMPKDGLTGFDNGSNADNSWSVKDGTYFLTGEPDGIPDYPMVFHFTGDDDVWVYIDGVLFLDLSGIHRHVGGRIDFAEGKVYYFALDPKTTGDTGENPEDAYRVYTFAQILEDAGADPSVLNEKGTFADYSTHSFNFYYMERGSGSSVCRLNFNFPLLRKNAITVSKETVPVAENGTQSDAAVLGNPDYYFNILSSNDQLFVGPGSVTGISQYKITDANGSILKNEDGTDRLFETDQYGIFTLKAGQSAIFEGIKENSGSYYVQELIKAEDNGQYPNVYVNGTVSRHNAVIDWTGRTYFPADSGAPQTGPYGCRWFGRSGENTDSSIGGTFYFEQENRMAVAELGKLSITKQLIGTDTARTFDMEVTLDGQLLPAGTVYTVGGADRIVAVPGMISLAPGETAIISNIISGTAFRVREMSGGDYKVAYSAEDPSGSFAIAGDDSMLGGIVRTGSVVSVVVTNTEQDASVEIPVTKSFTNGVEGMAHSYTFHLTQVTDATGTAEVENGTAQDITLTFDGLGGSGAFTLTYLKHQIRELPATCFYRIVEGGEGSDSLDNTQVFVAEILVREDGDGIAAELVAINGSAETVSADFVNTLAGSLTLTKTVRGSSSIMDQTFDFEIALTNEALPASYDAVITLADGTVSHRTLTLTDGKLILTGIAHGTSVTIAGIPAGTVWTATETTTDGFNVSTLVGGTASAGPVAEGTVTAGNTLVAYTNMQTYVLPETGGTGTTSYAMAGLLLCGAVCLLYSHQKRRRGAQANL